LDQGSSAAKKITIINIIKIQKNMNIRKAKTITHKQSKNMQRSGNHSAETLEEACLIAMYAQQSPPHISKNDTHVGNNRRQAASALNP
jgi:hypothetical protein